MLCLIISNDRRLRKRLIEFFSENHCLLFPVKSLDYINNNNDIQTFLLQKSIHKFIMTHYDSYDSYES